jgi:hypothetical protein
LVGDGGQNITLKTIEQLCSRFKCSISDLKDRLLSSQNNDLQCHLMSHIQHHLTSVSYRAYYTHALANALRLCRKDGRMLAQGGVGCIISLSGREKA